VYTAKSPFFSQGIQAQHQTAITIAVLGTRTGKGRAFVPYLAYDGGGKETPVSYNREARQDMPRETRLFDACLSHCHGAAASASLLVPVPSHGPACCFTAARTERYVMLIGFGKPTHCHEG